VQGFQWGSREGPLCDERMFICESFNRCFESDNVPLLLVHRVAAVVVIQLLLVHHVAAVVVIQWGSREGPLCDERTFICET